MLHNDIYNTSWPVGNDFEIYLNSLIIKFLVYINVDYCPPFISVNSFDVYSQTHVYLLNTNQDGESEGKVVEDSSGKKESGQALWFL